MEDNNLINTVNIPLTDYNILKDNLEATRDLLDKATIELNILREQEPKNEIVVIETKEKDKYGLPVSKQKLFLDIKDPGTSDKILEVISKVDNSELVEKVEEKEAEIKGLKISLEKIQNAFDLAELTNKHNVRREEELKREEIRKLKKGYEETVEDLEEDKEILTKSLADLKKDKTEEQLELLRQEEIDDLNEKISALETYKCQTENLGFFRWAIFKKNYENALSWFNGNRWSSRLARATRSAIENVEQFVKLLNTVGKLPEKVKEEQGKQACNKPSCDNRYNVSYVTMANGW